jgi:hypothetical protein
MMRGEYQTVTAGQMPSLSIAGVVIRYAFYTVVTLVFGLIGLGILSLWKIVPKPVDGPVAFRIASEEFTGKPSNGHIVSSSKIGRVEVLQYGQLHNRNADLAVVMVQPPPGIGMGTHFVQDLSQFNLLQFRRPMVMSQMNYDLETRFGEFRATEVRIDTDGRWKQCLAFRSRFGIPQVYLTGWYCDGSGAKPSPNALACSLDKLVLDRELESKAADNFIHERMTKAAHCQAEPVSQTVDMGNRRLSPPSRWSQPSATYQRY